MAHMRCDFRSDAMGMNTSMTVILPEKTDLSQVPVVYLLHGLEDNCTGWARYTSVERYAREKNAALVMPEEQRVFPDPHHPEKIGITLDEHGWADVDELLAGISERCPLCREQLEEIVRTDAKSRYSFSADGQLIRCNQGHSIPVDVELEQVLPPEFLWHGTAERFLPAIFQEGLRRMSRLYVHLSATPEIAQTVGARHGKPVVLRVQTGKMAEDGYAFYRSVNGVWLTEAVPAKYLEEMK